MDDWDLTAVGKILGGLSLSVAGIIIGALLLGFSVPHGTFLMFTCIVLTVICAGIVIIRLQRSGEEPARKP